MSFYYPTDAGQLYLYPQTPSPPRSAVSPITPHINAYGQYYLMNPSAFSNTINYSPALNNVYNPYIATPTPALPHHPVSIDASQNSTTVTDPPQREDRVLATPSPGALKSKVVLILILNHGKEWADRDHQDLLAQLRDNGYHPIASSPASAALSITRYNPSIILVMEANSMDKACDSTLIAQRLRDFTRAGGILIFGGVPHAFTPSNTPNASTVFNREFHVNWVVGARLKMQIGDTSGRMQPAKFTPTATFLNGVALKARLYRPYTQRIKKDEPCAVALQAYGDGCIGFMGNADLFNEDARFMLLGMCAVAEGMVRRKGGRSPAEVMVGGKVWEPSGWHA